jgi:ABC-type multidrug transport system ATPase subunit/ABC-type multidrug transport system permease subunit
MSAHIDMNQMPVGEYEMAEHTRTNTIATRSRQSSISISSDQVATVLTWSGLEVRTPKGKIILQGSGQISGGLWAIMGPSGSGKSSLLNALACRLDPSFHVKGNILLNGKQYSNTDLKRMGGYVLQDDVLNPFLTVHETLMYTAALRLPALRHDEQVERVLHVIKEMGLTICKDVVVGSALRKGISGGQRKRLCVAQELLLNPSLLFLDEPTSGLDSATALDLITKLRNLSRTRCTIICSIHQPQNKIFNLFDSIILVREGKLMFHGSTHRALEQFGRIGFPVPPLTNPADHLIDVLSPLVKTNNEGIETETLLKQLELPEVDMSLGSEKPFVVSRGQVPWMEQFSILCRRNIKEQFRKSNIIFVTMLQTFIMAVLIGTVFFQIGKGQKSQTVRNSVLFFCCINQGVFGSMTVVNSFPSERALSLRERAAGSYFVSAYFLSKSLVDSIMNIITPIIFSCIVYSLVGLDMVASKFVIFICFMVLCNLCATSLALLVSALCRTSDLSMAVLPMALEVSRLFGGFYLSPANLPTYFSWLDALSFVKYAYVGIALNELTDLTLTCSSSQMVNGECPISDGEQVIALNGFDKFTMTGCAFALVAFVILARFFAFVAVKYLKH